MHRVLNHLIIISVFLLLPFSLPGQEESAFRVVKDLKRSLLIYSNSQKSFVPHAFNAPVNAPVVSAHLSNKEFSGNRLYVCGQPGTALFIDQKIVVSQKSDTCISLDIDSLFSIYGRSGQENLFLSVYHKELEIDELQFAVIKTLSENDATQIESDTDVIAIARSFSPFKNFYIVGLLLILALIAMVKVAYPKIFNEFFSLEKIFSFKWREDSFVASRAISGLNLLFLVLYSLLMAFIVVVLAHETGTMPDQFDFISFADFSSSFFSWIIVALIVYIIMIFKYIIIYISSSLLGFKDIVSYHFLDYIRISQIFMIVLLVIISFSTISFRDFITPDSMIFPYIIFTSIFLTTTLLLFKLLSSTSYRNMHLFSYLCTTEILPLIISIKFFLNL